MFNRKTKYNFDPEKLSYYSVKQSFWQKIIKTIIQILPAFFISFFFLFILLKTIDSPLEKHLQSKTDSLLLKYDILGKKMLSINSDIELIAETDNKVFRPFFEMDSIPYTIRNAGFGGSDRYQSLRNYRNTEILINTTKQVDILSKQLYIQSVSFDELIANIKEKENMRECIPSMRPVNLQEIDAIGTFGMRMHPILHIYRMHEGVDLCAADNTKIYASGNGVVSRNTFQSGLGNYIVISHGYGYESLYAHLNKALVSVGDSVTKGDFIALMGTTGTSTQVHLHYEVHKNGTPVNPMKFYYWDLTDVEYCNLVSDKTEAESFFMK